MKRKESLKSRYQEGTGQFPSASLAIYLVKTFLSIIIILFPLSTSAATQSDGGVDFTFGTRGAPSVIAFQQDASNFGSPPSPPNEVVFKQKNLATDRSNNAVNGGCTYSLTINSQQFGSVTFYWQFIIGTPLTVTVNTQAGCLWTPIVGNGAMITITSGGGNRTGPGNFVYRINQNSGAFRTGRITIVDGLTITNHQDSPSPACVSSSIAYNQTVQGAISTSDCTFYGSYSRLHTFSGVAGEQIRIEMNSTQFTPFLKGTAPSGGIFIYQRPIFPNSSGFYTLPETGTYRVAATYDAVWLPDNPNPPLGSYSIRVTRATNCSYALSPTSFAAGPGGSSSSFTVNTQQGCPWTAVSNSSWITITGGASGNTTGTVSFSVAANAGPFRTGTITAAGQTFTVTQASGCAFSLSPTSHSVSAAGGSSSFTVNTTAGCAWTAQSAANWITITGGATGTGAGTVSFSVAANNTGISRNGSITAGGQTFTVTQPAAVQNCTYSISPPSANVAAAGGGSSFQLTTQAGCSWAAQSNANWLTTSGSGSGSGTVIYSAAANNTNAPRTGTITVGGQTFTVTQSAPVACVYTINPTTIAASASAASYAFNIVTASNCSWTAATTAPWITFNNNPSGSGNGSVSFSVQANTASAARTGTITVANRTLTVVQSSPANPTFSLSGRVTNGAGQGVGGVSVLVNGAVLRFTVTDASGNYRFDNLPLATYTITPSIAGANFAPANRTVNLTERDLPDQDFTFAGCTYNLSAASAAIPHTGAPGGFTIQTPANCPRTAVSNAAWLIVPDNAEGSGAGVVNYIVQRNYGAARSATVSVNGQIFTVTQAAAPATAADETDSSRSAPCDVNATVNQAGLNRQVVGFTGTANGSFQINIAQGCEWTAVADKSWIAVNNGFGAGANTVNFSVVQHDENAPRSGSIVVNGVAYTVVQTANQLPNCSLDLNRNAGAYPQAGVASDSFNIVNLAPLCRWQAFDVNTSWVRFSGVLGDRGSGAGAARFSVLANDGALPRVGTIVVGDKAFMLNQAAAGAQNCVYQLSSAGQTVESSANSAGSFTVTSGLGCAFQAAANAPWITITGGEGVGTGTVSFVTNQANNTAAPRTGTITVNGQTFTVTQNSAQAACSYTINPGFQRIAQTGAAGNIQIASNAGCANPQWTAASNADWIQITSGATGNTQTGQISFLAQTNTSATERVGMITVNGLTFTITQAANQTAATRATQFDFDGDSRADLSVFRAGVWYIQRSQQGFTGINWGLASDVLAPADFDGDGRTDLTVFRNGNWFSILSSNSAQRATQFGQSGDLPVPADFTGDGRADVAVFRPANGTWYWLDSTTGEFKGAQFGSSGDNPVVGDFDGDGRADLAVTRIAAGSLFWYWTDSSTNQFRAVQFGLSTDAAAAADFDGDGKTDVSVFRPSNGTWYRLNSSQNNQFFGVQFGQAGDVPVPADYDGDGKADVSVFRAGIWYRINSQTNQFYGEQFGIPTDKAVPATFVR